MYGHMVCFAGLRKEDGALLIVMSNQNVTAKAILDTYKNRWSIEELFRKLKSSGFNWEGTHMKHDKRLVTLLIILGMATLGAYLSGLGTTIP
ncbi:hypothetical protein HCUR_01244 [Holospora curviuscula]|uniref:Transposase IS4-like domain-containing protein n=1 Tax=Holospora curviuscula TaxID=1082868 RepID=A0A2S5R7M8_9PROT|nr:hypothetical protein HCUR_01244 [Holospora curviuscula]